jgi:hypothetical protein
MSRAPILLVLTALACRDKDAPKRAPVTTPPAPVAKGSAVAPERPELPEFGGGGGGSGTIRDRFATQEVDATWKAQTEHELRGRFAKMKHAPSEIDCKASLCRLTIAGSESDVAVSIDELQGLRDQARTLLLTTPVKDGDQFKLTAYLEFER